MLELFISAMMLGFLFNAAPGAIFTERFSRGLQAFFNSALSVHFGSFLVSLSSSLLGLFFSAVLFALSAIIIPIAIFAVLLLALLAFNSMHKMQIHF